MNSSRGFGKYLKKSILYFSKSFSGFYLSDFFNYRSPDFLSGHLQNMQWCNVHCFAFYRILSQVFLQHMKKLVIMIRVCHVDKINKNDSG